MSYSASGNIIEYIRRRRLGVQWRGEGEEKRGNWGGWFEEKGNIGDNCSERKKDGVRRARERLDELRGRSWRREKEEVLLRRKEGSGEGGRLLVEKRSKG